MYFACLIYKCSPAVPINFPTVFWVAGHPHQVSFVLASCLPKQPVCKMHFQSTQTLLSVGKSLPESAIAICSHEMSTPVFQFIVQQYLFVKVDFCTDELPHTEIVKIIKCCFGKRIMSLLIFNNKHLYSSFPEGGNLGAAKRLLQHTANIKWGWGSCREAHCWHLCPLLLSLWLSPADSRRGREYYINSHPEIPNLPQLCTSTSAFSYYN